MITVHCGLPKTGTTSIQTGLRIAGETCRRLIIVPTERDDTSEEWWRQCLVRLGRSRDGILSHEGLLFANGKDLIAQERIQLLRDCLAGSPFRIVVYLRPQIDWLASLYLHGAATGSTESPEFFWQRMRPQRMLIYSNLLTALREESGAADVVTRVHSSSRDVVADFFNVCGLGNPPRVTSGPIRENLSISAVQAPILIAINHQSTVGGAQHVRLRHVFQQILSPGAPEGYSPFSEDIQLEMSARYMQDWKVVAESVLIQDEAEAEVFTSDSVMKRWSVPIPYAGDSLASSPVQRESLRTIGQLALILEIGDPGRFARLRAKLKTDLGGLPGAIHRAILRQIFKRLRWGKATVTL